MFWVRLQLYLAALWWGSLTVVGLIVVPTLFMMVTVVIFPMLGLFVGYLSYRKKSSENPLARTAGKANAAMPMYFAVATMVVEILFINLTHKP